MTDHDTVLVTGATGLVGGGILMRMLRANPRLRAFVLVRDEIGWHAASHRLGNLAERIVPVRGDMTVVGLGLEDGARRRLAEEVTMIVHAAADTSFSRPLDQARLANTQGTRELLSLSRICGGLRRFAYVSTAFVAGRHRGLIREMDNGPAEGWVNSYEQSKYEAEALVRASAADWVIFRPSTIVCRGVEGSIPQINAVHRALRVYYRGLAAMMPGGREDLLDLVTADYVNDAIARVTLDPRASRRTLHLCAGSAALPLGELVDTAYELWARDPMWRKRGIEKAVLTDLATYTLFANAVIETGDARLGAVLSSLSHFIPQLALSKQFDTTVADRLVGCAAPEVRTYWSAMLAHLLAGNWGVVSERAA
ncbi:MAG: SDR family oxidoreductase [Gemmatimonadaceae bacterium]|nr:SDR family oxidoreductase [Gemmatimonadaceae bacterium]